MNRLKLIVLSCFLLSFFSWADTVPPCENNLECIEAGQWDLGVALGYGKRSNPLKDYDDIPIYMVPTFAYYGEYGFFDNGNFGYTLTEKELYTINVATSFSTDSAYFHRWDPSNIFLAGGNTFKTGSVASAGGSLFTTEEQEPVIGPLETRRFTYLAGLEAFIYTRAGIINFSLAHDMLNVHQGTEAQLKWIYNLPIQDWNFEFALKLDWKSEEIVDYYYGVRESESPYWNQEFKARSALNTGIELTSSYVITQHWDLLFLARYTHIADAIADSPLLNEEYTSTFYIGSSYRF
ncbi:MipA/OmpV family protein [Shewanella sp. D64]|uniref:MipA/OmpV family protein n=1 Tax=unclassified Shewanella TaxID=196818 RepID=UPI0022BA5F85|nr:MULTISPECIES: MipA/OmpV family protein [unclassified Shewanella]MEC4727288.1 MipA/OmpV family protein [Shewanella sp. D64]MEC4739443.1 MipA/OmpV family protein [Shewanella sp. E94]WBJ96772.1 MipA/OmpV family protein [Shewanella sp. MTB7]